MRIMRDSDKGHWVLWGVSKSETAVIDKITKSLSPGDVIKYVGKRTHGDFLIIRFEYGCLDGNECIFKKCFVRHNGDTCSQRKRFSLAGTTMNDKNEASHIWRSCYFGLGSLTYLGTKAVGKKKALLLEDHLVALEEAEIMEAMAHCSL